MKNGKKPTKAQKIIIREAGLMIDDWLVSKSLPDRLVLVQRYTDKVKVIYL